MGDRTKSLAKIVVFTKDEYDLIHDFLEYHGLVFGHENIVVVDNGSTHPEVLRVYEHFSALGTVVVKDTRSVQCHSDILNARMTGLRTSCHYLIPLDTDEFIVIDPISRITVTPAHDRGSESESESESGCTCGPDAVRAEFIALLSTSSSSNSPGQGQGDDRREAGTIRFNEVYQSIPDSGAFGAFVDSDADAPNAPNALSLSCGRHEPQYQQQQQQQRRRRLFQHRRPAREIRWFSAQGWDKVFFRSSTFLAVEHGNHRGVTTSGGTITAPRLSLLHFHNTGRGRQWERCRTSITGYRQFDVDGNIESQLTACEHIISEGGAFGGHRVEQYYEMLMREFVVTLFASVTGGRLPSAEYMRSALELKSFSDVKNHILNGLKQPGVHFPKCEDEDRTPIEIVFEEGPQVDTTRNISNIDRVRCDAVGETLIRNRAAEHRDSRVCSSA